MGYKKIMTQRIVSVSEVNLLKKSTSKLTNQDITWILGLYGTAIGAGTLFLPINAGLGGFWPLVIMALIAFPLTYFSHRGLTRFVLSGSSKQGDITEVVEEHFGKTAGKFITLLYFFAIYPILLVYSVAVTNTVFSLMVNQLHMAAPPRALLAGILVFLLMLVARSGRNIVVKTMSILVFPFVFALMSLAIYLIPQWNGAILEQANQFHIDSNFAKTLWLAIPVMVFSFNHSPIISSFAMAEKDAYGKDAEQKSSRILKLSHIMMVLTVMFFVFSCVFSLTPGDLLAAKEQNISILSYLANHLNNPVFAYVAPIIALVAISKSFLGHYLGASEGFNGIIIKSLRSRGKTINAKTLDWASALIMGVTAWIVATLNPSILGMIETLGGPVIAVLLFLMPMYAIHKVPAMRVYANKPSNVFVVFIGCVAISAILYSLFV
jgi:serine transporter